MRDTLDAANAHGRGAEAGRTVVDAFKNVANAYASNNDMEAMTAYGAYLDAVRAVHRLVHDAVAEADATAAPPGGAGPVPAPTPAAAPSPTPAPAPAAASDVAADAAAANDPALAAAIAAKERLVFERLRKVRSRPSPQLGRRPPPPR